MNQPRISRDSTPTYLRRIRRLMSPLATATLAAMTVCSAWAQTVSIGNGSVLEGNAGTTTLNVPVTRSGDTSQTIGLTYRTNDGGTPPATAGTDYEETEFATAALPAGATSVNLPVTIKGDADIEPDERFLVHLLSAHSAGPRIEYSATSTSFAVDSGPESVATADFNGDGRPDMAVVNRFGDTVSVLLNNSAPGDSTPSFAPKTDFGAGTNPRAVTVADFNGDGRLDLAVSGGSRVSILINATMPGDLAPSFLTRVDFGTGGGSLSVTAADFNGDGRPDLAAVNANVDSVSVLRNTTAPGAATPSFAPKADFAVGSVPFFVTAADFNGDGRPDLAVANQFSDTVSVLINNGTLGPATPSFEPKTDFAAGDRPQSIAVADLNGDGRPDLAVANIGSDDVSVLLNTATPGATTAGFAPKTDFFTGDLPFSVAAGDLNGDGRPDLAVANIGAPVSVLLNTGAPGDSTPSFALKSNVGPGSNNVAVATADFNVDGRPDMAVTSSFGSPTVKVLLNTTATGNNPVSFAPKTDFDPGDFSTSVTDADFNGDGRPDLAVANRTSDVVSVLLNTTAPGAATASYGLRSEFGTGESPLTVIAADLNGDGRPDLATANRQSGNVSVLLNTTAPGDTTPSFASKSDFGAGGRPFSVAAGDLNGDGRPDLAVANLNDDNVSVLLNTTAPGATSPSFATKADFAAGNEPRSVTVADLNGDGRPDLATANFATDNVSVLLNSTAPGATTPSFASKSDFGAGDGAQFVTAADLNGDGRPDLAVSDASDDTVAILINITAAGATSASFAQRTLVSVGINIGNSLPNGLSAADLNGDGRLDLAVGYSNEGSVSVLRNLTAPGAAAASFDRTDFTPFFNPTVRTVDINSDGRPDLAGIGNILLNSLYGGVTISGNEATATILNDDVPQLSIDDVTLAEGSGGGTTVFTFTVSLPTAAAGTVSVNYAAANDTATVDDADYAATSGTLTFNPGDLSKSVTVQVNADTKFETSERFFVNLSNAVGATIGDGQGAGNITNDDTQPSVRFVQASSSVSEGVGAVNLAVELSNPSYQAVSFSVSGTPAPGADYSGLTTGPISIAAGNTTATVSLTVTDDSLDEPDELVSLALTSPVNASLGGPGAHALTIQDNDDTPTVSFASASLSVDENEGTVQSRVILSAASSEDVMVTVSVTGGSASAGADYTLPTDSLVTIPAGQTFADLSIPISNDALDENNETLSLQLFTPGNATLTVPFTQTVTIVDDDATPTVSFDTAGASYNENAGTVMIPVRLSAASALEIRAAFAVSGSANAADFSSTTSSPLVFPPNSTAVNIVLGITNDMLDEDLETVVFSLGALTNATAGANPVFAATITDDDAEPTVRFTVATQNVGEAAGMATVSLQLSGASGKPVTVPLSFGGTASRPGDYNTAVSSVTIAAGDLSGGFSLSIVNDNIFESPDENILVSAGSPSNATLASPGSHTLTIVDDEEITPDSFSFTDVTGVALGSVQTSNAVSISGINTGAPISVIGGTYSIGCTTSFTAVAGTINSGQTVCVRHTSSASLLTAVDTTLTIGGVSDTYTSTTLATDTTPDTFTFTDVTNVALNSAQTSNAVTIAGINTATPISVSGGTYSVGCTATFTAAASTINSGQTVCVKHTASGSFSTAVSTTLTIGGVSDIFTSTTRVADTTPNAFTFMDQTNVPRNSVRTSGAVTITGIEIATPISIVGGGYSIGCNGTFTTAAGTISNGQTVCVRHTSASTFNTGMNTVLTVGGISDTFTTVTAANGVVALLGVSFEVIAGAVGSLLGVLGSLFGP
ncbi:MAG: FG-GAP-like repeat-containing protein [Panacagrimonas sp.]